MDLTLKEMETALDMFRWKMLTGHLSTGDKAVYNKLKDRYNAKLVAERARLEAEQDAA